MTLLFIGGFLDKRTGIVKDYHKLFQQNYPEIGSEYYQWHEKRKIRDRIHSLEGKIIVIGHSYGATTATNTLHKHEIDLLITVDPVSRIWSRRHPKAKRWININAKPDKYNLSDYIALAGGKWGRSVSNKACEYYEVATNHARFVEMFEEVNPLNTILLEHLDR